MKVAHQVFLTLFFVLLSWPKHDT